MPEKQVDDWEKVTGPDNLGVIPEENRPILTMAKVGAKADGLLGCWPPVYRSGAGQVDAEFHEFATDALPPNPGWLIRENPPPGFRAPEGVLPGHLLDQRDGFPSYPGAPTRVARLEPPGQPKALAMPAQEGIGLEDEESFPPSANPAGEEDEPEAVGWGEAWLADLAMEEDELLAEEGVLGNELGFAASEIEGRAKEDRIARRPGEMEATQFQGCQCGANVLDKPVD